MMILNILKYTLGILLAIAILAGTGAATALYFMNRTSAPPAKPMFANDYPAKKQKPKVPVAKATQPGSEAKGEAPKPTPTPTPSPEATETPKLPPGAYQARVTWNQGLIIRTQPNQDAERIGGVGFNARVIVLQQSPDNSWQKIRLEGGEQEGWVKAGNTQKVDAADSQ
jgi:hypothetical protein